MTCVSFQLRESQLRLKRQNKFFTVVSETNPLLVTHHLRKNNIAKESVLSKKISFAYYTFLDVYA